MLPNIYSEWSKIKVKAIIDNYGFNYFLNKKILDLGCGYGDISGPLLRLGSKITALDARQDHLAIGKKKFPGLNFVKSDLDVEWKYEKNQFDLILALGILCHTRNPEELLRNICNSCTDLVLETAICDSDDSYYSAVNIQNKNIQDQSVNGSGVFLTPTFIERILKECGFSFEVKILPKYKTYNYHTGITNTKACNLEKRRLWIATKTNADLKVVVPKKQEITPPALFINKASKTPFINKNIAVCCYGDISNLSKTKEDIYTLLQRMNGNIFITDNSGSNFEDLKAFSDKIIFSVVDKKENSVENHFSLIKDVILQKEKFEYKNRFIYENVILLDINKLNKVLNITNINNNALNVYDGFSMVGGTSLVLDIYGNLIDNQELTSDIDSLSKLYLDDFGITLLKFD